MNATKKEEEEKLKEFETKINIKTKTLTVLSKEENMAKLKALIEKGKQRLADLAEEWGKVQRPLLKEYNSLQNNLLDQEVPISLFLLISPYYFFLILEHNKNRSAKG